VYEREKERRRRKEMRERELHISKISRVLSK